MSPLPNGHAVAAMAITILALYLFSREKISIESSSLFVLTLLTLGFVLFPFEAGGHKLEAEDFFLGFGNEALIAICALTMASQGLVRTGALTPIGRWAARLWALSPRLAMLVILLSTAVISAFMNNTPQVVVMIPILISVAIRSGTAPSRTLMPMTFSAQLGGMLTPIGTGLNLLVIGTAAGLGVPRFGMFDFALPAAIGASVGLAYLWLVAPKLLPDRETQFVDVSPRVFHGVLHINEDSVANGKTIAEILESTAGQMKIRRIQRGADLTLTPLPSAVLRAGDRVFVDDKPENLKEFEALLGATLHNEDEVEGGKVTEEHPLKTPNQQLAEIIVTENSPFAHRTLGQAGFTDRYELVPLALHRAARNAATGKVLTDEVMRVGDVLLVQGSAEELAKVKSGGELLVLDATTDLPYTERAGFATVIMISIVVLASTKLLPVSVAALVGVVMMIVAGCMTWRDAIRALDAAVIFLTAASLALSLALMKTGGAEYLAQSVASLGGVLSPFWILSLLILVMAIFANVVSNTSAAVIGTPIAVSIAHLLGQPPEPFVLAVLFGANMGFCTPMADNCNLLVFSAGGYHFNDFVRVGVPLTLLMWLTFSFVLPRFYPLG